MTCFSSRTLVSIATWILQSGTTQTSGSLRSRGFSAAAALQTLTFLTPELWSEEDFWKQAAKLFAVPENLQAAHKNEEEEDEEMCQGTVYHMQPAGMPNGH